MSVIYLSGCIYIVHFDAIRSRLLRRTWLQVTVGLLALANNVRVLIRERTSGMFQCTRRWWDFPAHLHTQIRPSTRTHCASLLVLGTEPL